MLLFQARGIVFLVLLALWIYCILDVIATDGALMRNLPKGVWLLIVILIPDVGSIAWLLLGRPERAGWRPGDTTYRKPYSTRFVARGPDDDPNFIPRSSPPPLPTARPSESAPDDDRRRELEDREAELRKRELDAWEADLARREAEIKKKEGDEGGMYGGDRW